MLEDATITLIEVISLLIALFAMIAAAFSSAFSWRSVRNMDRQIVGAKKTRLEEVRPYIVLAEPELIYKVEWQPSDSTSIHYAPRKQDLSPVDNRRDIPEIRIKNIGPAAAKQLYVNWLFTCENFEEFVLETPLFKKYGARFQDEEFSVHDEKGGFSFPVGLKDTSYISYCSATGSDSSFQIILLPWVIFHAISIYAIAASQRPETSLDYDERYGLIKAPPLRVLINYKSQLGEELKQEYLITAGIRKYSMDMVSKGDNKFGLNMIEPDHIRLEIEFKVQDAI